MVKTGHNLLRHGFQDWVIRVIQTRFYDIDTSRPEGYKHPGERNSRCFSVSVEKVSHGAIGGIQQLVKSTLYSADMPIDREDQTPESESTEGAFRPLIWEETERSTFNFSNEDATSSVKEENSTPSADQ